MIDAELVTRKMVLIASDLDPLQPIAARGREAYVVNRLDQAVAERLLERMIGRMIDINYHVITESGHPPPSDYFASFVRLGELGVLEPDFARSLAASAGLRNRIVHEYNEIDHQKVFEGLLSALRDIPTYLNGVRKHLERA